MRHRRYAASLSVVLVLAFLSACTTVIARNPVPEDLIDQAAPYGLRNHAGEPLRVWGDTLGRGGPEKILARYADRMRHTRGDEIARGAPIREVALALSGGGPDGAYGAGLLAGWTARGDRPEFGAVTGISTGAIVALFGFLGPDYDDVLREIYTTHTTDQLLTPALFAALTGGTALTDTRGYRRLIEAYVTDEVMAALAREHERGRTLLIGTTNLDAARPVIWSATGIAATRMPQAKRLLQDVIQASSAIPAAFPPVLIPVVTPDGRRYDEMHVDGGATQQVMLFSPEVSLKRVDDLLGVRFDRTIYVVINNKLDKPYRPVRPRVVSIAGAAVSSLLSGAGGGDVYKIFAIAVRDGIDLQVTWIPRDFDGEPEEPFDPDYMLALYNLGFVHGVGQDSWNPAPPDFALRGAPAATAARGGG